MVRVCPVQTREVRVIVALSLHRFRRRRRGSFLRADLRRTGFGRGGTTRLLNLACRRLHTLLGGRRVWCTFTNIVLTNLARGIVEFAVTSLLCGGANVSVALTLINRGVSEGHFANRGIRGDAFFGYSFSNTSLDNARFVNYRFCSHRDRGKYGFDHTVLGSTVFGDYSLSVTSFHGIDTLNVRVHRYHTRNTSFHNTDFVGVVAAHA